MTTMHHELFNLFDEMNIHSTQAERLKEEFDSEEELVNYLELGGSLTDYAGIGGKTARKVSRWFERKHPDAHRRMREKDESVFTDFETDEGSCGSETADGEPVWGAYCPQEECGHLNLFEGEPEGFAGRPYRCQKCNWVSLMAPRVSNLKVFD